MNAEIRNFVSQKFEESIENLINEDKVENWFEWKNNPLHASLTVTVLIDIAQRSFKEMLEAHHLEFGIDISKVDKFVDGLAEQVYSKYFYS